MAIEEDRSAEALGELVPSDVNEGEARATAMEVEENEDDDTDKTEGVLPDEELEKAEDQEEEEEEAERQENKGDLAGGNQEKEEDQEERQGEQTEEMMADSGEHAEEKRGKTEHEQAPPTAPFKKEQKGHRTLTPHTSNEEAPPRKTLRVRGDASPTMDTGRAAATDCAPSEGGASTDGQDQQRVKGACVRPVARVLLGACKPETQSGASVGPRWEEEMEAKLQKLLGERDFAGAAALQKEADRRAAQEKDEDFEADLACLLARRDFAGAAALQAEADKRAARPTIEAVKRDDAHQVEEMRGTMRADHEAKIKIMLERKDYARAAALEKQFDDLAAEVEALVSIPDLAGAAKGVEEARGMPWGDGQDQQRVKGACVRPVARVLLGACKPETQSGASVGPRWEEEMEAKLQKLLGERDFAGAAALQKEADRRAAQEKDEDFEADLACLLARRDFAGAAALQAEADKRAARPTIEAVKRDDAHQVEEMRGTMRADHEAKIKIMLERKDYARAAALEKQFDDLAAEVEALLTIPDLAGAAKRLEEARGMPWGKPLRQEAASTGFDARVVEKANRAREAAVAARSAATAAENVLEERRQIHEAEILRFLAKSDYLGAAKYEKEKEDMVEECRSKNQLACDKESFAASRGRLAADADHSAAARVPRTAPLGHRGHVDQGQAVEAPRPHGVELSVADLMRTDAPMPAEVRLQGVRVLSCSKVSSLPMRKGKNKNKDKSKGKGKDGQGKRGKCGKTENARQDAKVMYVGQDKHVIAIAAFGDDVNQLPESILGCLVNVHGLRPRAGQMGTLYWSELARIVKSLEQVDAGVPPVFEYETAAVTQDLATMAHIQDYPKGDFVALVIRPQSVEARYTEAGEPYLLVHGYDMNGAVTGALRFWRYEDGDIIEGKIYIIRGLKIVDETCWSDDAWKYVPKEDGTKTVEIAYRTALEEVTDVVEVAQYFF